MNDGFVGRGAELERLGLWLEDTPGLLTLVGPGGAGKTRLSLELAHLSRGKGPVAFCDLSGARGKDTLVAAIARGLGLALGQADPEEGLRTLGGALGGWTSGLIILDNAEHLLDETAWALDVLWQGAGSCHFLVTSRHPLNLRGEELLPLGALSLEEAEALIWERQPRLPGGCTPEAMARIWSSLDGLPLALEMAAGRAHLLSLEALAERLDRDVAILRHAKRGVPDRHQTMVAAVEWSLSLLEPWQAQALAQCAVFRGSFDLEGAEAVVSLGAEGGELGLLGCLETLLEHSLIRIDEASGARRVRLYEATREVARMALARSGEEGAVRARHGSYFSRYAPDSPSLSRLSEWAQREAAEVEVDNLRAVLDGAIGVDHESAARVALTLAGVIYPQGRLGTWAEAQSRLGEVSTLEGVSAHTRCRVLLYRLTLLLELEIPQACRSVLAEALRLCEEEDLRELRPWVKLREGSLRARELRFEESKAAVLEAIAGFESSGEEVGLGLGYGALGYLYRRSGRLPESRQVLLKAEAIARRRGDVIALPRLLANLAYLDLETGNLGPCVAAAKEIAHLCAERGDDLHRIHAENIRWEACLEAGSLEEAKAGFEASIAGRLAAGHEADPIPLGNLARISLLEGRIQEGEAGLRGVIQAYEVKENPQAVVFHQSWQGLALGMLGRPESALALLKSSAEACRQYQDAMGAMYAYLGSAVIHARQGSLPEAHEGVEAACEVVKEHPSIAATGVPRLGDAILFLGRVWASGGQGPEAEASLGEVHRALEEVGYPPKARVLGRPRRPLETDAGLRLLAHWVHRSLPEAPVTEDDGQGRSKEGRAKGEGAGPLTLGSGGRFFTLGATPPVKMGRRHAARRLLVELVRRRLEGEGPLALYDAFDVGWPGQDIDPEAAAHRVYVTISSLRKLGLEGVILTDEEGYHLDPKVEVRAEF